MNNYNTSNIVTCSFVVTVKKYNSSLHKKKKKKEEEMGEEYTNEYLKCTISFILDKNDFPPGIFLYLLEKKKYFKNHLIYKN